MFFFNKKKPRKEEKGQKYTYTHTHMHTYTTRWQTSHTGQPINTGLYIDETYDIGRVEDVHWNPWYSDEPAFVAWQLKYGRAFVIARSDWVCHTHAHHAHITPPPPHAHTHTAYTRTHTHSIHPDTHTHCIHPHTPSTMFSK